MPPPAPPDLAGEIAADAHVTGMWSAVHPWPLIPIHAVLLPDGRLLTYGSDANGTATGSFIYDVWTPDRGASNGHMTLPNGTGTDIFCNAQLVLPNSGGDIVLAGGDIWEGTETAQQGNKNSVLFKATTTTLTRAPDMNRERWYATMTTLVDGRMLVHGGRGGADRPEIRRTDGSFKLLSNVDTSPLEWFYPRNFVAPDGRVFGLDVAGAMYYIDTTGEGTLTRHARLDTQYRGTDSSAAMFEPGRILQFGGNSNGAIVIDITGGGEPVVWATSSMSTHRRSATATLLADGSVLATGGSTEFNELVGLSLHAEIWNPATGKWTVGSNAAVPRLYHSQAILLPDASVLVGGGGAPGPLTNLNVQTYYPPYLFDAQRRLAPRPRIVTAPDALAIGESFQLAFDNAPAISKVALVKSGSVTHNWNMDQRYVPLQFTASASVLTVQMPASRAIAPPGYYLLFVVNANGVPSVAKIVRVP